MKICFFGIYDPKYSRNEILLAGLSRIGAEVIECRADWKDPLRYWKLAKALIALRGQYDCVYAAYPSSVPAVLARMLSRKPVIADAFYSMYDAVVNDRREILAWHPRAWKLALLDWLGVVVPHAIVTDTEVHKRYWVSWPLVRADKIHTVYLGINDAVFRPLPVKPHDGILVHFQGKYMPLQGVPKIIEAARLCAEDPETRDLVRFRLVGSGQESKSVTALFKKYQLKNVEFVGRVPLEQLNTFMSEADIVLGIFGDTDKAARVIPNKVYEGLAAGKAMITMDSPAIREIFTDKDLILVPNEPVAMAEAIKKLAQDPVSRDGYVRRGREAVLRYSPERVASDLVAALRSMGI